MLFNILLVWLAPLADLIALIECNDLCSLYFMFSTRFCIYYCISISVLAFLFSVFFCIVSLSAFYASKKWSRLTVKHQQLLGYLTDDDMFRRFFRTMKYRLPVVRLVYLSEVMLSNGQECVVSLMDMLTRTSLEAQTPAPSRYNILSLMVDFLLIYLQNLFFQKR